MDLSSDIGEMKRQMLEYINQSHKHFALALYQITSDINKLKNENEIFFKKCKQFFDKIDPFQLQDNLNNTLLSDVSQISSIKKENFPPKTRNNSTSKINIQNLVINKKVQIAKNFSKLRINTINSTNNISPEKMPCCSHKTISSTTSHNTSINTGTRVKTPNRIRIDSKSKLSPKKVKPTNQNSSTIINTNTSIIKPKKIQMSNNLNTKNSLNLYDNRKLSIVDIPSINALIPGGQKRDSSFEYLYGNNQKILLILAKADIVPINLRLLFLEPIQFVYSTNELKNDCITFLMKKKKELTFMKNEYVPFELSTTIQVMFCFITKKHENLFYNEYYSLQEESRDKKILSQLLNILGLVYNCNTISNEKCSLKETLFNLISHKRLQINNNQRVQVHNIIQKFPEINDDIYLGQQSQKNKLIVLLILLVREIHGYSLLTFNNPSLTPMICFDSYIKSLTEYQNEINKIQI
jgi:hypothetical protein